MYKMAMSRSILVHLSHFTDSRSDVGYEMCILTSPDKSRNVKEVMLAIRPAVTFDGVLHI